jgi:hypothetical protein
MAQQTINIGSADGKTGDTYFDAFTKVEANFTDVYSQVANIAAKSIVINSTADLPAAFSEDNMCYIFGNTGIVIPDAGIEITGENVRVTALNANLPVTYNGSGNMFYGADNNISFDSFSPRAVSGRVFSFTDSTSSKVFFAHNLQGVNCDSFASIGDFDVTLFDLIRVTSASSVGVVFTGSGSLVRSVSRVAFISPSASFIGIDLGTSVSQLVDIDRPTCAAPAGAFLLSGAASSANIVSGGIGRVQVATLAAGAALNTGVDAQDIRWDFRENPGVQDSRFDCDLYFSSGATNTITVANSGEWYEIGTPTSGTWESEISNRFTTSSTGVMTYTGEHAIDVTVDSIVVLEKSGGGSDVLQCRIAKNWDGTVTDDGELKTRDQTQSTTPSSIHPGGILNIVTGDDLRLIFSNNTSSANIIVDVSQFRVSGG